VNDGNDEPFCFVGAVGVTPKPRPRTLGDFIVPTKNGFAALSEEETIESTTQKVIHEPLTSRAPAWTVDVKDDMKNGNEYMDEKSWPALPIVCTDFSVCRKACSQGGDLELRSDQPSGPTLCQDVASRVAVTENQACSTVEVAKFGLDTPPLAGLDAPLGEDSGGFSVLVDGQAVTATWTTHAAPAFGLTEGHEALQSASASGLAEGREMLRTSASASGLAEGQEMLRTELLVKEGSVKHCCPAEGNACGHACSDASTCTAKTCNANHFDTDVVLSHASINNHNNPATTNFINPATHNATTNNPSCPCSGIVGSAPRWLVGADEGSRAEIPVTGVSAVAACAPVSMDIGVCPVFDGIDNGNEDIEEDAVCAADEHMETEVAMDSGAVDHVIGPKDLPGSAVVKPAQGKRANRNFTAANGTGMNNYGEVDVVMQGLDDQAEVNGTFAVTDVTRALHSASRIADNDCTIVITKGDCKVYKGEVKITGRTPLTTYRRKGGLYVRRVKLRAGRMQQTTRPTTNAQPTARAPAKPVSGFTRPGNKR